MGNYDDIVTRERPRARTPMPLEERAKIFLPFAALKGHEEAIKAKQKIVIEKKDLSEDMKDILDFHLNGIRRNLENERHPVVTIIYYDADREEYLEVTGMVSKLNDTVIQIVNERIQLNNIVSITGAVFEETDEMR